MHNVTRLVVVLVVAGFLISSAAYAQYGTTEGSTQEKKAIVVDAGNTICPVTGEKVNGKDFYEYKGKRYGLCCPMCQALFSQDPEKYSAIAEKEIAGKNKGAK